MARAHVVMADEVLRSVDRVAGTRGRSRFLEEAAREKLERLELEQAIADTAGIAKSRTYMHWKDREAAATWVRETRGTESTG